MVIGCPRETFESACIPAWGLDAKWMRAGSYAKPAIDASSGPPLKLGNLAA